MKLFAGVLLALLACRVLAFDIDGRVVAVLDGDTVRGALFPGGVFLIPS